MRYYIFKYFKQLLRKKTTIDELSLSDPTKIQNLDLNIEIKTKNLLQYTKLNNISYSADKYPGGYHTFYFDNFVVSGQRDPKLRISTIPFDFSNKVVLDIGCNAGGMLFSLSDVIKYGIGVDYDFRLVNTANAISNLHKKSNLRFFVHDLTQQPVSIIDNYIPTINVDVIFFLSVCDWIDDCSDIISYCSNTAPNLYFESNGSVEKQAKQKQILMSHFSNVILISDKSVDDISNLNRKAYFCSNN